MFTMNEYASANVYVYLSFLLRIMFAKIYFYKLAFTLKHYNLMCEYLAQNLKADVNILVLFQVNWCCHAM